MLYTIRNNTCETKVKKTYINSYIYIYIYIFIYIKEYNVCNKSGHKTMVHVMRKKVHQNLTTSLKTLSPYLVYPMRALPLTTRLLSFIKLLPLFVTSDKGCITESSSTHHHT